jgi:hypothetical protein
MFYQVSTGATGANALTGIKAAHSAFIKRPDADAPAVADTGSVKWQPQAGAGIAAAKRPTPAQAVIAATAQPSDIVEISDEGRALLDGPDASRQIYAPNMGLEGTVVRLVADVVYGKMDPATAGKFVNEVQRLITGDSKTESVEERVVNREKGLELANYIAENYIDDPADRQKFLDGVKHFADNAELRDKGYFVMEGPEELVRRPGQSMIPGLSPPQFLPGWKDALNEALKSVSNTEDGTWMEETIKIFLRNAPAEKYGELAQMFEAGEMRAVDVLTRLLNDQKYQGDFKPAVSQKELAEKEREVAHIIEQTKNKLDMNAVKEDVQNMIKEILSNSAIQTGFLKGMFNQQPN